MTNLRLTPDYRQLRKLTKIQRFIEIESMHIENNEFLFPHLRYSLYIKIFLLKKHFKYRRDFTVPI